MKEVLKCITIKKLIVEIKREEFFAQIITTRANHQKRISNMKQNAHQKRKKIKEAKGL